MSGAKFARGDIIMVMMSAAGDEYVESRPALVLTPALYNASGLALVAPISLGGDFARHAGFAVPISEYFGTSSQAVVLCNQVFTVDLVARDAVFDGLLPIEVVNDVLARIQALID
ncbi:type II toxin-antitoxin system PemK/MazF family toxin [Pseudomonas serbica]|uniref:type II toxin-antitoxin system PemK/MazF family toxin n=1 Tax=Pseudomonas serbica TaxID=2965074 RepID=UPI00237A650C|nr:type II toxin-antitoxin system PemK/MazF family toxin [Pseudomonas serbica]